MKTVKIWEDFIDYSQQADPALIFDDVVDFATGQNETWVFELQNSTLILPKGYLVLEAFDNQTNSVPFINIKQCQLIKPKEKSRYDI